MERFSRLLLLTALVLISSAAASAVPSVTKDKAFFEGIRYKWPINAQQQKESTLADVATDPDQIIAMLREVYMNRDIPGIYTRGYDANGNSEGGYTTNSTDPEALATPTGNYPVMYCGVGFPKYNSNTKQREWDESFFGWYIPATLETSSTSSKYYCYPQFNEYVPKQEGYTLLLVEMRDEFQPNGYPAITGYDDLRKAVASTIKSVRVLMESKRRYENPTAAQVSENGTWFKIDCDKLNSFFLLSKGRACYNGSTDKIGGMYRPTYFDGSKVSSGSFKEEGQSVTLDTHEGGYSFLYHMFEQFSPSKGDGDTEYDLYKNLVNGQSFPIVHDCPSVPFAGTGHQFNMLAAGADPASAQDVRDLMFFLPDYRLQNTGNTVEGNGKKRDTSSSQKFFRYTKEHAPMSEMYVIRLDAIDGKQVVVEGDSKHTYQLDLKWSSNLSDILPAEDQMYELYRVIDGEYVPVVKNDPATGKPVLDESGNQIPVLLDANTFTYTDYVPMTTTGQQVTYAVRGQDKTKFLSLQTSNLQSYLIPGYDKRELLTLRIDADNYSRYDPATQRNYYWNAIPMSNNLGTNVTQNFLSDGKDGKTQSVFKFVRKLSVNDDNPTTVAVVTLTNKDAATGKCRFSIAMQNQETFNGSKSNPTTWDFEYPTSGDKIDEVDFKNFTIYDNFSVSTAANEHPREYIYQVQFEAAESFKLEDGELSTEVFSNNKHVSVYWTVPGLNGAFAREKVDDDQQFTEKVPDDVEYTVLLRPSPKTEVVRYDICRWDAASPPTVSSPVGYADNEDGSYSLSLGDFSATVATPSAEFGTFIDHPAAGAYNYVPVIEVFPYDRNRTDRNTYGAPILNTAVGKLKVSVIESEDPEYAMMSNYMWKGDDDNYYSYYSFYLNLDELEIPTGYQLYKLRAWRKVEGFEKETDTQPIDGGVLGEILSTRLPRTKTFTKSDDGLDESYLGDWYLYEDIAFGDPMYEGNAEDNLMSYGFFTTKRPDYMLGERSTKIGPVFGHQSDDWAYGDDQEAAIRNETRATFGARRLKAGVDDPGTLEKMKVSFIVRAYFTKEQQSGSNAPRKAAMLTSLDGKYYIAEGKADYTIRALSDGVITGVDGVSADRQVSGVIYYNTMGLPSVTPWQGVNIVVTRYTDGSASTAKVVR